MLSHVAADTSHPVLDTTIGSILVDAATAAGDRDALVVGVAAADQRRRWTYEALCAEDEMVGGALTARCARSRRARTASRSPRRR